MVDKQLLKLCEGFDVTITYSKKGTSNFVEITSNKDNSLGITVQYVNGKIYCVYFLNSQFFEIVDSQLYAVVGAILAGEYKVMQEGLLHTRNYVAVDVNDELVFPEERIAMDQIMADTYRKLPERF